MNRALEKVLAAQLMTWEELKKAVCAVYVVVVVLCVCACMCVCVCVCVYVVVVVLCVCLHVQKSSVWRM